MKRRTIIWLMIFATVFAILYNRTEYKKSNEVLVYSTFLSADLDPEDYIYTINLYKPVRMVHVSKGDQYIQYQIKGAPQGNFYALEGSTPLGLGISEYGYDPESKMNIKKEKRTYIATKDFDMLSSYAAPVIDNWSTPQDESQTKGNELQFFSTCKECFKRIN